MAAKKPRGLPRAANKKNAREVLVGPMVPVITHYHPDLSLDLAALALNIDYLIQHGIRTGCGALLIAGAGGDFPMLTPDERVKVFRAAVEAADGRVPLVMGSQDTNEDVVLEMAQAADELGAFAIQVSPAYYFEPSPDDVARLVRRVNKKLIRTGIMLYNTWWEGYNMPIPLLDQLMKLDRVVSLKWSVPTGAYHYMQGIVRYADTVAVIDNNNTWPLTAMLGGTGYITHLTTIWPEHDVALFRLTQAGKYQEAMDLILKVDFPYVDFRIKMAGRTSGEASVPRAGMELCGRPGGPARPPARTLTAGERAELRSILVKIGAPVAR